MTHFSSSRNTTLVRGTDEYNNPIILLVTWRHGRKEDLCDDHVPEFWYDDGDLESDVNITDVYQCDSLDEGLHLFEKLSTNRPEGQLS